ncbi:MAG TPA: hypothetical protein PLL33_05495 [Paracoccus sp. (in: a-proteobacteria)]|nr:hypothetical protein [Paracoccus sp. (in: a-proteobacteria)]
MFVWPNCRQMVADIDALLDTSGFSFRDRRQVLLAEVWRLVQEGHDDLTFTIRGHMGSPRNLEFLQTQAAGPT